MTLHSLVLISDSFSCNCNSIQSPVSIVHLRVNLILSHPLLRLYINYSIFQCKSVHTEFQLAQQCIQISTRINSSSVHTYIFVCFTLRVILQGFVTQNATMGSQPIRIQLGKILREIVAGKSCGKLLRENLAGNCCGTILREIVAGKSCGKLLPGNSCGKILREILAGKSCGKFLWENLAGNSCGKWMRGKSQFKKGIDWWKFSIWNRVMGSQPIRIQLGKILQEIVAGKSCRKILREIVAGNCCRKILRENLAGNCCGKILREILAGKSCGKILWEIVAGNCCGKILQEIVAGKSCGQWRRGKSQFKKGIDWWKFSIWNRVKGSQPIRIQLGKILREIVAGNCCGKILWEIVAGKSCGKLLRENLAGNSCRKILWEILAGKSCGKFLREMDEAKKPI